MFTPTSSSAPFPGESCLMIHRFPRGTANPGIQWLSPGTGVRSRAARSGQDGRWSVWDEPGEPQALARSSGGGCGRCCAGGRSSCRRWRHQPQPRSQARTLLVGRTRLFHLQTDKGHFFPFLPPGFALCVLKLYFSTISHSSDFPAPLLSLCFPVLTRFQTPRGPSQRGAMSPQSQTSG